MGQDFNLTSWGGDGFRLFRPTLPRPTQSPPFPALLKVIIENFSYPKTLLFKQTYQYLLILFYLMWFSAFILSCVILWVFFFFLVIVLLNTWIYFSFFFSKSWFIFYGINLVVISSIFLLIKYVSLKKLY